MLEKTIGNAELSRRLAERSGITYSLARACVDIMQRKQFAAAVEKAIKFYDRWPLPPKGRNEDTVALLEGLGKLYVRRWWGALGHGVTLGFKPGLACELKLNPTIPPSLRLRRNIESNAKRCRKKPYAGLKLANKCTMAWVWEEEIAQLKAIKADGKLTKSQHYKLKNLQHYVRLRRAKVAEWYRENK